MASKNKRADKAEELKGRTKKKVGRATGDPELEVKGEAEQAKGGLKQAIEKVKDAFRS